MDHTRSAKETLALLRNLLLLVEAHRGVTGKERIYRRMVAPVLAEVFAFGRHNTRLFLKLGNVEGG